MFKYLDAENIDLFMSKFQDKLTQDTELSVDELYCLSKREFNEVISVIFDDVVITKDNIHLYYEFMSDEDLLNYSLLLITGDTELKSRFNQVVKLLNLEKDGAGAYCHCNIYGFVNAYTEHKKEVIKLNVDYGAFVLKYDIFEVKDTLKPIEEYIAEIKESEQYKEYRLQKLEDFLVWKMDRIGFRNSLHKHQAKRLNRIKECISKKS